MRQERKAVDQKVAGRFDALAARIEAKRNVLAAAGSIVATWRMYRGRRLGPYYRLSYREHGRQRSIYLGRSPELVERVRGLLAEWQAPGRERKELSHVRAVLQKSLRRQKAAWERDLRAAGLYTRGYTVRGWRRWARNMAARKCWASLRSTQPTFPNPKIRNPKSQIRQPQIPKAPNP